MTKPTFKELIEAVEISRGYASDILNENQRPSRALAIYIFRKTGWRHDVLNGLSDEDLAALERIEPWTPQPEKAA